MKTATCLRSYFFVLPHKSGVFDNLKAWNKPDCYILDLQDGCPDELKEAARANIRENIDLLAALDRKILLRVNEYSAKEELEKDMKLLELDPIGGIMLPMIRSVKEVEELDQWMGRIEGELDHTQNRLEIVPLIETVSSTLQVSEITAASNRLSAIALGLFDLFVDTNARMNDENINFISNMVMLGAKGAGLPFIDSPFTDIHDYSSFYTDCNKTIDIGSDGKIVLHPDHIEIVNSYFSISEDQKNLLTDKLIGYAGGCSMNAAGEFIGPPVEKMIKRELSKKVRKKAKVSESVRPKIFKYGLDINAVYEGQTITCPYEITIDDSWTTIWSSLVSMGNFIETSDAFCQEIGLPGRVMPFSAMLNLTLCMAVEPYSETCLLHLGLEEVVYENPAHSGDTFRCYIYIEKLRNTSDGQRSVITSRHILLNQRSERVLSFKRNTLFPHINELEAKTGQTNGVTTELHKTLTNSATTQLTDHIDCTKLAGYPGVSNALKANDLIVHDASRHIGESENLMFTTLFRNTHPVHFNYLRHDKKDIIICGGFVMAVALANALKDLKQVVDQQIISCSHINKIGPLDTISSVSYIHESELENDCEVLTIKTIGLRNIDAATELSNCDWPMELFSKKELRPAEMELLLSNEMPEIFHKVCIQILWKIWRPA